MSIPPKPKGMGNLDTSFMEKRILIVLFLLAILLKIPAWNYPIAGDSNIYAELTESLATKLEYSSPVYDKGMTPHGTVPPLFPLLSVPFFLIFKSPVYAIKFSAMFWSALTILVVYLFSRTLKFDKITSVLISLFVLFNPWFFYFNGIFPLSESLANFLLISGVFIYFLRKSPLSYLFAGLVLGLAIITRFASGFFVFPFIIFSLYELLRKKNLTKNICFVLAASFPICVWILRNIIVFGGFFSERNAYSSLLSLWAKSSYMLIVCTLAFIVTFSFLLLFILKGIIRAWRQKEVFWLLVIAGCIFSFFSYVFLTYTKASLFQIVISRTRHMTSFVPILTIFAFLNLKRVKRIVPVLFLIVFIALSAVLSYGSFKDITDRFIPLPAIYSQRSEHRAEAIEWANENIPQNSRVSIEFNEQGMVILGYFAKEHLNKKLVYAEQNPDFVISDLPIEGMTEIYRTKYPFSYVYFQ